MKLISLLNLDMKDSTIFKWEIFGQVSFSIQLRHSVIKEPLMALKVIQSWKMKMIKVEVHFYQTSIKAKNLIIDAINYQNQYQYLFKHQI